MMEHDGEWTLWFGNIRSTDDGQVIGGEYRLNTNRVKQWVRLSLENAVKLHDQTWQWGHAHTALSQTVSRCSSHGSFCGRSHTKSQSFLGQASFLSRYCNKTENQKPVQRTTRQRVGLSC